MTQYFMQVSIFLFTGMFDLTSETKIILKTWNTMQATFMINLMVDNPKRYDMDERIAVLVMELDDCNISRK